MKYLIVAALILASHSISEAAVYKCKVDGKTVYQQTPCAESGDEMKVNAKTPTVVGNDQSVKEKACNRKTACAQMTDCKDAKWYFEFCGQSDLDADNDGIPCEEICLKKAAGKPTLPGHAMQIINDRARFLESRTSARGDAQQDICAIYRKYDVDPPKKYHYFCPAR